MKHLICLAGIFVLVFAGVRPAGAASAAKLLAKIRQVDGAGSGLDADTVRGLTPDQIADLRAGRLYVQIQSERAPDGNLWGWLLR